MIRGRSRPKTTNLISHKGSLKVKREFNILIEEDEDGILVASVPELHGCHTQASSLDELMIRIREAIELCVEVEQSQAQHPVPKFVGIQRISVDI